MVASAPHPYPLPERATERRVSSAATAVTLGASFLPACCSAVACCSPLAAPLRAMALRSAEQTSNWPGKTYSLLQGGQQEEHCFPACWAALAPSCWLGPRSRARPALLPRVGQCHPLGHLPL